MRHERIEKLVSELCTTSFVEQALTANIENLWYLHGGLWNQVFGEQDITWSLISYPLK